MTNLTKPDFRALLALKPVSKYFLNYYNSQTCIRCILRYLKCLDFEMYRKQSVMQEILTLAHEAQNVPFAPSDYDASMTIKSFNTTDEPHTPLEQQEKIQGNRPIEQYFQSNNVCTSCLGILQILDHPDFLKIITDEVSKQGYDFESFKLNVKTPLGLSVRGFHKSILASQEFEKEENSEELKEIILAKEIDPKTLIKWILAPLLAKLLDRKSNLNDDFCVNLNFWNYSDTMDVFMPFSCYMRDFDNAKSKKKLKTDAQGVPKVQKIQIANHNIETISKLGHHSILGKLGTGVLPIKFSTSVDVQVYSSNIYICGHYMKFSRSLCQTPWEVDGVKLYATSLSEEMAKVITPHFSPTGGREDIDVRMLGSGRPFIFELESPKSRFQVTPEFLKSLEDKINESELMSVRDLNIKDISCFDVLHKSAGEKVKAYCCVTMTAEKISDETIAKLEAAKDILLKQKTPFRVLHRRTLMVRDKFVHKLKIKRINDFCYLVYVLSSAGTYIKEFIHGDLHRTVPSFGDLVGFPVDIVQLDV